VYEIVYDSLIVIRTDPSEIRADTNSCLYRGTILCIEGGSVSDRILAVVPTRPLPAYRSVGSLP
jgi:hypothetical protein